MSTSSDPLATLVDGGHAARGSGLWGNRWLLLLLAVASALRVALVVQGGQLYWPDERLYTHVLDLFDGNAPGGLGIVRGLVGTQEHLGFALISAAPAAVQWALGRALGRPVESLVVIPSLVFSQVSVIAIALVYAIARRAGRDRTEATFAALLMASTTTVFYYARHLLPYDSALALGLLALWFGVGQTRRDSLGCGAAASAAFITYNGYWLLAGVVMLVHLVGHGWPGTRVVVPRAARMVLGFVSVPLGIMAAQAVFGAPLLVSGMRSLAGSVTDGYAPEGFRVPWAFLWHAEHALLLVWLIAVLFVVFDPREWRSRRRQTALAWVASAVVIYLGLASTSALLHVFVVMGRQSRQLVPFFCLATAAAVAELLERRVRRGGMLAACVVALLLQAGWNVRQPLLQRFPRDVIAESLATYGDIDYDTTLVGPPPAHPRTPSRWLLLNAQHLYQPKGPAPALPRGTVELLRFPHPLQFLPYQYEGFSPIERQVLRRNDIAMRLVDIGPPVEPLP